MSPSSFAFWSREAIFTAKARHHVTRVGGGGVQTQDSRGGEEMHCHRACEMIQNNACFIIR
jgi:hypothetical protein